MAFKPSLIRHSKWFFMPFLIRHLKTRHKSEVKSREPAQRLDLVAIFSIFIISAFRHSLFAPSRHTSFFAICFHWTEGKILRYFEKYTSKLRKNTIGKNTPKSEKYSKFGKILRKSGKIPVRPQKRSSLQFGWRIRKNTQHPEANSIHPKKDNVCGIQFFSPYKSAEKVRTFWQQNFTTKLRKS